MQRSHWPTPTDWKHVVREDPIELRFINMTVPNSKGIWPEYLGGRLYPEQRGRLSLAFMEQLKGDCPDCPTMPDHEDGAAAAAAAAIPSEGYLFLPPVFISSWWYRGRKGAWDANLVHRRRRRSKDSHAAKPGVVMGHVHWVQSSCDIHASSVKLIPLMASYHYNWTAAHAVSGEQVYFASMGVDGLPVLPVPKVLVLGPAVPVDLDGVPGMAAHYLKKWQLQLQALAKLALLSGRVPVWPTVDCSAGWVGNMEQRGWPAAPFELPGESWLPYYDRRSRLVYCHRLALMEPGCLYNRTGMTVWEFEHLKLRHRGTGNSSDVEPRLGINAVRLNDTVNAWTEVSVSACIHNAVEHNCPADTIPMYCDILYGISSA